MARLVYCNYCKKNHRMDNQLCPSCCVHIAPQPVSEEVYNDCNADYDCDGCVAYRDHLAI